MCLINCKLILSLNAKQRGDERREGAIWGGGIGDEVGLKVCVCVGVCVGVCGKSEESVAPSVQQIASAHTTASAN